jgi:hypothetical protein
MRRLHCGTPMVAEKRTIYCCEACRDAADDGEAPRVVA